MPEVFTHNSPSWRIPSPDEVLPAGYASPESATDPATGATTNYASPAFAATPAGTLFASHESKDADRAAWFEPVPAELSADPRNPTVLRNKSGWFRPVEWETYKAQVGSNTRDEAFMVMGGEPALFWRQNYSVGGEKGATFGMGTHVWWPGGYHPEGVYGRMAVRLPAKWAAALGGTLLCGGAFSNSRDIMGSGQNVYVLGFDFTDPPASGAKLDAKRLVFYPNDDTFDMPGWTRECKPAGGAIIGDYLVMASRHTNSKTQYLDRYPIRSVQADGSVVEIDRTAEPVGIMHLLRKGSQRGKSKTEFKPPLQADETFTLETEAVARHQHIMKPNGEWVPAGTRFPAGYTFDAGHSFHINDSDTTLGYFAAFGTHTALTFYHLSDLTRAARGEIPTHDLPFAWWYLRSPGFGPENMGQAPDNVQVDQHGRLLVSDRIGGVDGPLLKAFTVPQWMRDSDAPVPARIDDYAVDTDDAKLMGEWFASTAHDGFYGDNYLHDGNEGKGEKDVAFPCPHAGRVEVYARWTSSPKRSSRTLFTVYTHHGFSDYTFDQRENGGKWVRLGAFNDVADVMIFNRDTDGHVIADAVAFVPVGAEVPTPDPDPVPTPTPDPPATEYATRAEFESLVKRVNENYVIANAAHQNAINATAKAMNAEDAAEEAHRRLDGIRLTSNVNVPGRGE